jgi:drug/metabolite transporter (DMT)-like permease
VSFRRFLFILLVVLLISLMLRPRGVWAELRRIYQQWNTILQLIVLMLFIYMFYGLYRIWVTDLFR